MNVLTLPMRSIRLARCLLSLRLLLLALALRGMEHPQASEDRATLRNVIRTTRSWDLLRNEQLFCSWVATVRAILAGMDFA